MWEEIGNFLKGLPGSQTGNLISGIGGALAQGKIAEDVSALGKDATTAIFGQRLFLSAMRVEYLAR
jgi:hypothetical protein